jgi:hypothetical protein
VDQDSLSGFELGIVEQHVFDRSKRYRRASGITQRNAFRHRNHEPRRQIDQFARKAVNMKTHNPADVFA